MTAQLCRLVSALGLVGGVMLALVAQWFLPRVLGASFAASLPMLWVLLPGIVLFMIEKVVAADLTGRGYIQYPSYGSLMAFTSTAILDLLLIPRFGIMAAPTISSLVYIGESVYLINRFSTISGVRYKDIFLITRADLDRLREALWRRPLALVYARSRNAA